MAVINRGHGVEVPCGPGLLGRVIDGIARPLDDQGPLAGLPISHAGTDRPVTLAGDWRIREVFKTNVRAIDGLLTCGRGQRVGIFAGSGVGKSTLLGEIAKGSDADVNVIALIGERGREVQPFIEDCLGPKGWQSRSSSWPPATDPPLMRVRAAADGASRSPTPSAARATTCCSWWTA